MTDKAVDIAKEEARLLKRKLIAQDQSPEVQLLMTDKAVDIVDEAGIERNNWFMYGSCKPNKEPYLVTKIIDYVDNQYTKLKITTSIEDAIKLLSKFNTTEGYIVSEENKYIGKISLLNLINKKNSNLIDLIEKQPLIIDPNSNLIFVIKKLSKFVGESIPIVNKRNNEMIGIISENDVLQAYLDISDEINQIEKH